MRSWSSRATPGPLSRTHSEASPPSTPDPIQIASPSLVCWTAFCASPMTAWVRRWRSALQHGLAARLERPGALAETRGLVQQLVGQGAELDLVHAQEVAALGLGEQQQVVDEAAHAVQLVRDQRDRLPSLLGVVAEQLEMAADDRDRRAQLVRGVLTNARWLANAPSSRSTIALNVRESSAISSRPTPGSAA